MRKRVQRQSADGATGLGWNMGWKAAAGILWLGWIVAVGFLAGSFPHGLEETDEASYVLASANPWASPGWGIFFGFGLHPLWQLGGGTVLGFRWAGLVAMVLAVAVFTAAFRSFGENIRAPLLKSAVWLVLPSLGLAALMTYTRGMRAPGYDWLLVVAGLFFAAGWMRGEEKPQAGTRRGGSFLVGTGLFLVFLAKWTSLPGYLGLGAVLLFLRWKEGTWNRDWLMGSLGWFFLWLVGFVFYAGPTGIHQVIQAGWSQTLTGSHDGLIWNYPYWILQFAWVILRAWFWVAVIFMLLWLVYRLLRGRAPDLEEVAGFTFLAFLAVALFQGHGQGGEDTFSKGKMILATWLAGIYALTWRRRHAGKGGVKASGNSTTRRVAWLLCLLPFLNGLGTATGLANYTNHGAVFFVATGWIWLAQAFRAGLPAWLVAVPIGILSVLYSFRVATTPWSTYRIGSVWGQTTTVRTGPEKGRLKLTSEAVQKLEQISRTMRQAGYREGDPIIAITSRCGLVHLLGGVSPGVCWYMDNPNSGSGSLTNLGNLSPEILSRVWLILVDDHPSFPALQEFWPTQKAPLPVRIRGNFFWLTGDPGESPRAFKLYRPLRTQGD